MTGESLATDLITSRKPDRFSWSLGPETAVGDKKKLQAIIGSNVGVGEKCQVDIIVVLAYGHLTIGNGSAVKQLFMDEDSEVLIGAGVKIQEIILARGLNIEPQSLKKLGARVRELEIGEILEMQQHIDALPSSYSVGDREHRDIVF